MSKELVLRRHWFHPGGPTIGMLLVDEALSEGRMLCYTLEDAMREEPGRPFIKVPHETAIPTGRYQLTVDYSRRFRKYMFHILNVPQFDGIRIHSGNTAVDTDGCVLVGQAKGDIDVLYSRAALESLLAELTKPTGWDEGHNCAMRAMKEETWITVENGPHLENKIEVEPKEVVANGGSQTK